MDIPESSLPLEIGSIQRNAVPPEAMRRFEFYSVQFISPEQYTPGKFHGFWKVSLGLGICYITEHTKINGDHGVYFYQYDSHGTPLGYGEIGEVTFQNSPHVWLHYIGALQKRKGFARSVLPFLGSISEYFFKNHSIQQKHLVHKGRTKNEERFAL